MHLNNCGDHLSLSCEYTASTQPFKTASTQNGDEEKITWQRKWRGMELLVTFQTNLSVNAAVTTSYPLG